MTAYTVVWRVRGRDIDLRGLLISGNYRTGAESSQEPFHFEGHLDDPLVSRVVWIRGSGMTMNESFQTPELAGAPCKTSIGRRAVPNLLLHKLGIAGDIELACVWLPVLGMEEGLESRNLLLRVGMKSRVVKRSDLAARLKVKPNSPIGEQLATQRRITKDEGELIDGGIFADRPVQVSLRFDDAAEDVETILREASSQ